MASAIICSDVPPTPFLANSRSAASMMRVCAAEGGFSWRLAVLDGAMFPNLSPLVVGSRSAMFCRGADRGVRCGARQTKEASDASGRERRRSVRWSVSVRRTTGELIIFWVLPGVAIIWIAAFFLFPGFLPPMSPQWSAQRVAAFYVNHTSRVRYSMILFNWFCVALIPILMLIVERMRGMAHRTPVLRFCVIGVAGAAPIAFLTATIFWLLAAFRPSRPPALTQLYNDLAWITFTCAVPFLVSLCLFLALAVYLDGQARPVWARWVGHFN